ncbi:helix-turn-helix domain-containing protein [Pseudomonas sp. zfem002]|uniref:helix-turn-helix domain-containing protein n=1 Tax=Pseudomonas sp. zfem002 TaxID=3078197 RepID=UPI00397781B3
MHTEAVNLFTSQRVLSRREKQQVHDGFFDIIRRSRTNYACIHGTEVPATLLRKSLALCPACIREEHIDITHLFKPIDTCRIHGIKLVRICPGCNNTIDWLSLNDYSCECGFNLRYSHTATADPAASIKLAEAISSKNHHFFEMLWIAFQTYCHCITNGNENLLLSCITQMATGQEQDFYQAINRIIDFYPSLHCRALLVPALESKYDDFREFALRYHCQSLQIKPKHHSPTCDCSEFSYSPKELKLLIRENRIFHQMISSGEISRTKASYESQEKLTFHIHNLCEKLWQWENWSTAKTPATASTESPLLKLQEAANFLKITPSSLITLVLSGIIPSYFPKSSRCHFFYKHDLEQFKEKYVLRSEVSARASRVCGATSVLRYQKEFKIDRIASRRPIAIYLRSEIPERITELLNLNSVELQPTKLERAGFLNLNQVENFFPSFNAKFIKAMNEMGILKSLPLAPKKSWRPNPKKYFTRESVENAQAWLKPYMSTLQLAEELCYPKTSLERRFIQTRHIKFSLLGSQILIYQPEVEKIRIHINQYVTAAELFSTTGIPMVAIKRAVKLNLLTPIGAEHADYIRDLPLFLRTEADTYIKKYFNKKRISTAVDRFHK